MTKFTRPILMLLALAVLALAAWLSPQAAQAGIPTLLQTGLYKLALAIVAAIVAYYVDLGLFPYARPDNYLEQDWRCVGTRCERGVSHRITSGYHIAFAAALLRRAFIVGAVVIGVCLGL